MAYDNTKDLYQNGSDIKEAAYKAPADTIVLDRVIGPTTTHRYISGDIKDSLNAAITGANDVINGTNVALRNATILGDAHTVKGGSLSSGADKITVKSVSHGKATIIGDAFSTDNANVTAGHDTITINTTLSGGTTKAKIIGDVDSFTGSGKTFMAGNDNIIVKGSVTMADIYADARVVGTGAVLQGGNDTVTIGTAATAGTVQVDSSAVYLGHGNDTFTLHGTLANSTILGGIGNDKITVSHMKSGTINAGGGNDYVTITDISGGSIDGNVGIDTFEFGEKVNFEMELNAVKSFAKNFENFVFTELGAGGTLAGTGANDIVTIKKMTGGTFSGGAGIDGAIVNNAIAHAVTFEAGGNMGVLLKGGIAAGGHVKLVSTDPNAEFFVASADPVSELEIPGITMTGGKLTGSAVTDLVSIDTMSGGTIHLGAGDDVLYVNTINGTLNGGIGDDTLYLKEAITTRVSIADALKDVENFEYVAYAEVKSGGSLIGTASNDFLQVFNLNGGTINLGGGQDMLGLYAATSGIIDGGTGGFKDIIEIFGPAKAKITIKNSGSVQDVLRFSEDSPTAGTDIKLTGSAGFEVDGSMEGGKITGTAHADTFHDTSYGGMSLTNNSFIDGGSGSDVFKVQEVTSGTILGNIGYDTFEIKNFAGTVTLDGGGGNDTFTVEHATKGTILGGIGNDIFNITLTGDEVFLDGGDGADTFNIDSTTSHTVMMKDFNISQDKLFINGTNYTSQVGDAASGGSKTFDNVTVDFVSHTAKATLTDPVNTSVFFNNASASDTSTILIDGNIVAGGEVLLTNSLNGGKFLVNNTKGTGFNITDGSLTTGTAKDTIKVNTLSGGGVIDASGGNDAVTVNTVNNSAILGGAGNDIIKVTQTNNAKIYGGSGIDTITVSTKAANSYIDGGGGADTINLKFSNTQAVYATEVRGGFGADKFVIDATSRGFVDLLDFDVLDGDTVFIGTKNITTAVKNAQLAGETSLKQGSITLNFQSLEFTRETIVTEAITANTTYTNNIANDHAHKIFFNGGITGGSTDLEAPLGSNYSGYIATGKGGGFNMSGGFLSGSGHSDIFEIQNFSGGSVTTGLGGDTVSVNILLGTAKLDSSDGIDNVYVNSMSGSSRVVLGSDNDFLRIESINGGTVEGGFGDDTIEVVTANGGTFKGDSGDDTYTFIAPVRAAIDIEDSAGNDTVHADISRGGIMNLNSATGFDVHIGSMTGGAISASAVSGDTISVENMSGGSINTTKGNFADTIIVNNFRGGELRGDSGEDSFTLGTVHSGFIATGERDDTITVKNALVGTLTLENSGTFTDNVNIQNTKMSNTEASITEGDKLILQGEVGFYVAFSTDTNTGLTMTGGTITGSGGLDSIRLASLTGGSITGGDSSDRVYVDAMTGGNVHLGAGNDYMYLNENFKGTVNGGAGINYLNITEVTKSITVENLFNKATNFKYFQIGDLTSGTVTGTADVDYMSVLGQMNGGNFNGVAGNDELLVDIMQGGTVNGGAGNDSIVTNFLNGGIVLGGTGDDTLELGFVAGTQAITIDGGSGNDSLELAVQAGAETITVKGGEGTDTFNFSSALGGSETASVNVDVDLDNEVFKVNNIDYTADALASIEKGEHFTVDGITFAFIAYF